MAGCEPGAIVWLPGPGHRRLTACRQGGDEARRNLVFLGDQDVGRLGLGNDGDRVRFDLQLKICGLRDVVDRGAKRDVIQGKRDSRIGFRRISRNLQDDIDSPARRVLLGGVQRDGALLEEIQCLTYRGIPEVNTGNYDFVEFAVDQGGAARVDLRLFDDRRCADFKAAHRKLPALVDLSEHVAAGLVVGGRRVFLTGDIDAFHPAARGDVVLIDVEDLLVTLEGKVEPTRGVETVSLEQELFHLLDIRDESGSVGAD